MNTIHIAFCINDSYVPYVTVTMKSVIMNHSGKALAFYILTDFISCQKRKLIDDVVNNLQNVSYKIIYIEDGRLSYLKTGYWNVYTWYRICLPSLLPNDIKRVLYLDADTLVVGNIEALFELEMDNIAVAGCLDPQTYQKETFLRCGYDSAKHYICAGVLLMNLDYWREHQLTDTLIQYAIDNKDTIKFPDQDSINVVCQDCKIVLPLKYGIMDSIFRYELGGKNASVFCDSLLNPAIVHFAANPPWYKEYDKRLFHDEWRKFNRTLKNPVTRKYKTRGWPLLKMFIWNILHPSKRPVQMTPQLLSQQITRKYDS